jgi:hypothetical protein
MKTVVATLSSSTPYSASKYIAVPKLPKESGNDYETRTWRERCNVDSKGEVVIPAMAFKKSLEVAAAFLNVSIPGQGKSKYNKHFRAGILVTDNLPLGVKKDEIQGEWFLVPSDGRSGGTTRVPKCFPVVPEWKGKVTYHILDDTITQDVFEQHLREAGNFIGVGRFRPERGGFYGRYNVDKFEWKK